MAKMKKIWMQVSKDKYELPIAVADTAHELADKIGTTENNIITQIWHFKHSNGRDFCQFVCVDDKEEEE